MGFFKNREEVEIKDGLDYKLIDDIDKASDELGTGNTEFAKETFARTDISYDERFNLVAESDDIKDLAEINYEREEYSKILAENGIDVAPDSKIDDFAKHFKVLEKEMDSRPENDPFKIMIGAKLDLNLKTIGREVQEAYESKFEEDEIEENEVDIEKSNDNKQDDLEDYNFDPAE